MEEEIRQLLSSENPGAALPLAQALREDSQGLQRIRAEILLALALDALGRKEEALDLARGTYLATREIDLGRESLEASNNLARYLFRAGHHQEAVDVGQETLGRFALFLGEDNPSTLQVQENLARYQMAAGQLDLALDTVQEALDTWGTREDNPALLSALLTSMEILNRITLSRFIAFYGSDHAKTKEMKKRLGL